MQSKIILLALLFTVAPLFSQQKKANTHTTKQEVVVEINYGNQLPAKTVKVLWYANITALAALQEAAVVVTHPVATYFFVTDIDQVKAERGKTAWYYRVNGQAARVLASYKMVNPGDTVSWRFVEDVCSWKVDNPTLKKDTTYRY